MTTASERPKPLTAMLMEEVARRESLLSALKRVRANKGSPGIDGMTVEELPGYLKEHWPRIRKELLRGDYIPQPVERVTIPKPGGGTRESGVPVARDRFIQQAVLQVLTPLLIRRSLPTVMDSDRERTLIRRWSRPRSTLRKAIRG